MHRNVSCQEELAQQMSMIRRTAVDQKKETHNNSTNKRIAELVPGLHLSCEVVAILLGNRASNIRLTTLLEIQQALNISNYVDRYRGELLSQLRLD